MLHQGASVLGKSCWYAIKHGERQKYIIEINLQKASYWPRSLGQLSWICYGYSLMSVVIVVLCNLNSGKRMHKSNLECDFTFIFFAASQGNEQNCVVKWILYLSLSNFYSWFLISISLVSDEFCIFQNNFTLDFYAMPYITICWIYNFPVLCQRTFYAGMSFRN